jgi:hypothetical protein
VPNGDLHPDADANHHRDVDRDRYANANGYTVHRSVSDGHVHADGDNYRDAVADGNANHDGDAVRRAMSDRHRDVNADQYADRVGDRYSDAVRRGLPDGDCHGHVHLDADRDEYAVQRRLSHGDVHPDADGHAHRYTL